MTTRHTVAVIVAALFLGTPALAQGRPQIEDWTTPPYWTPRTSAGPVDGVVGESVMAEFLPPQTTILPFTAVTPCRLYDNRANAPFTGDVTYTVNGATEEIDFFATSATPYGPNGNPNGCTLPAAGTVGAWSLKFTYQLSSSAHAQGVMTAYPGDLGSAPPVGTILGAYGSITSGAAIVQGGANAHNTIKVLAQYAAATVVIDYNGYFAKQPVVTTLNALTGAVGVTGGTGITVSSDTISNTITVAANVPEGPTGPTGPVGATGATGPTGPGMVFAAAVLNPTTVAYFYFPPNGSGDTTVGGNWGCPGLSTTDAQAYSQAAVPMPTSCVFDALYVSTSAVPYGLGGGDAFTITLYKNGSSTLLSASGDSSVPSGGSDTSHTVSVVAGDTIALKASGAGVTSGQNVISVSLHCK